MTVWWLLPAAIGISLFTTSILRQYALNRSLMDIPNARSSHSAPTPRGGGIAIVLAYLLGLPLLALAGRLEWSFLWGILGAGAAVAAIGFLDDHGHIPARWRLLGHFLAATWVLLWFGGIPPITLFGTIFDLGWVGNLLAALYLVWLLNLYNFMDGIDGIASIEAVCVSGGGALLYWAAGYPSMIWAPSLLLFSVAGFLYWNFPPAKIFMGDAGSGFLGIILGCLSLLAAWSEPKMLWGWLILLGVFIVDATWTLMRRLIRGDKIHEAHRSHAYQYASRYFGRHLPVTLFVLFINLLWLLPISLCVTLGRLDGLLGVSIAYLPLMVLAISFKAGAKE